LIISNARVNAWISSKLGTSFAATLDAGAGATLSAGAGAELSGGAAKAKPEQANRLQAKANECRVMGNTEGAIRIMTAGERGGSL
jgi:hypothetical protein